VGGALIFKGKSLVTLLQTGYNFYFLLFKPAHEIVKKKKTQRNLWNSFYKRMVFTVVNEMTFLLYCMCFLKKPTWQSSFLKHNR